MLGALNLYSRQVGGFDDSEQIVNVFVAHAATSLANSQAFWAAQTLGEQLQEALQSRAVIEQAKGVLIVERRCSPTRRSTSSSCGRNRRTGSSTTSRTIVDEAMDAAT